MHNKFLAVAMTTVVGVSTAYAEALVDRIVGLEQAKHFQNSASMNYFIQTGAFSIENNALGYQKSQQAKTDQNVIVKKKGSYNLVLVGPMLTAEQVRNTAIAMSSDTISSQTHTNSSPAMAKPSATTMAKPTTTKPVAAVKKSDKNNTKVAKKTKKVAFPAERTVSTVDKDGFLEPSRYVSGFFVGIDGGRAWLKNHAMIVNNGIDAPAPFNVDIFTIGSDRFYFLGALAGYRWENTDFYLPAWSVAVRYRGLLTRNIGGLVIESSLPEFTNYDYSLNAKSDTLMAVGKLDLIRYKSFMPYLSGGVGVAFNRFANYFEVAKEGVTPRISPDFSSKSLKEFTYSLGAGVDIAINPSLTFSIGYEFQDYGRFSTGFGQDVWANQQLGQNSFRTNSLLLGIDYLFTG